LNATDKYPLDMAGRTYLIANFKKKLAAEDLKWGSLMMPCPDIRDFMIEYIKILNFCTAVF
jgi:hypothetical protein